MENKRPQQWNTRDFYINMCTFKNLVLPAQPCRIYPLHLELRGNRCSWNVKMGKDEQLIQTGKTRADQARGVIMSWDQQTKDPLAGYTGSQIRDRPTSFLPCGSWWGTRIALNYVNGGQDHTAGSLEEVLKVSWKLGLDDLSGKCSVCGNVEKQQGWAQHVKGPPR